MAFIDIEVFHGATDISTKVIGYTRSVSICEGIGTLELTLDDTGYSIDLWDIISIYEEGHKKGEYYVSGNERNVKAGTRRIVAQDGSKLLADYFIPDSYTIDYESYTGYWIDKFLTEAHVSHGAIGTGVALSDNTQLGLSSAYDTIQTLLQYSGWYLYFDENNVATIGSMTVHSGNPTKLTDSKILSVTTSKKDDMLRNRAIVWGNYDVTASGYIFADNSVNTPWNYDSSDMRSIVISNSAIYNQSDADELSRKMLSEFAKITNEKTIEVAGEVNVTVGSFVNVKSKGWSGSGLVTTIDVSFGSSGLVTTLILDQRCPRLFAYWGQLDDYVYIGTDGAGVWRKPIAASGWTDYSTAIPSGDLNITDLYINNQVFGTVTDSGNLYYKQYDDPWNLYTPSGIVDENNTTVSGLIAKALTINHQTNNLIVGYNNELTGDYSRAWVTEITPSGELIRADQVYIASGEYRTHIVDIDTNDVDNVVSVNSPYTIVTTGNLGYRTNLPDTLQTDSVTYLPIPASGILVENPRDYVLGAFGINEYLEHSNFIPSKVITQNEDPNNIYAYFVYPKRVSAYVAKVIACRVKFNIVGWIVTATYTEVDLGTTYGTRFYDYIYKSVGDNDNLYLVDTSSNLIHDVNFSTGTVIASIPYTVTAGSIYSEHYDNFIYYVYRTITGTDDYEVTYSYEKLNILDGTTTTVTMGSSTMTGYKNTHHVIIAKCFKVKFTSGGIIFMEWYTAGSDADTQHEFGLIYGIDGTVSKHVEWTNPGGHTFTSYDGIAHQRAISGFVGSTNTLTNISTSFNCYTTLGGIVQRYLSGYTHLDDTLSLTNTVYNVEYTSCDLPYMSYTDGRLACSTRYLSIPYFVEGGGTYIKIRKGIDGSTYSTVTAVDLGYSSIFPSWICSGNSGGISLSTPLLANTLDDVDDSIYILAKKSDSDSVYIIGINYEGELIKEFGIGPYTPYGYSYEFSVKSFTSNSMLTSIRTMQDRNGHYTYDMFVQYVLPKNPYYIRGTGIGYQILRQQDNIFTPILNVTAPYQVEISKPSPIEVFNITSSGILPVYQAETASGLFSTITPTYDTYDGRVFDIQSPSSFVIASGVVGSGLRYFALASDDGLKAFPTNLEDEGITIFPSGCYHLEMTNNTTNPYIFVTTSGDSPIFWEREPTASGFIDYSATLPSGVDITCVRCDDLL